MKRGNLLVFVFVASWFCLNGQTKLNENKSITAQIQLNAKNKVRIFQDKQIDKLLLADYEESFKNKSYRGYRIQIFSGNSAEKNRALNQKYRFNRRFPYVESYIVYNAPMFRVKVGSYRTTLEAARAKHHIARYFPNCYIIKDKIRFSLPKP